MAAAEQISSSSRNHLFQRKEIHKAETKGDFTVAIYNVLADFHIPKNREHTKIYQYCPTEDLYKRPLGINSNRHALLMEEVLNSFLMSLREHMVHQPRINNCVRRYFAANKVLALCESLLS